MASVQAESIFGYNGFGTNNVAQAQVVRELVKNFLTSVKFDRSQPFIKDQDLEDAVWSHFKTLDMGAEMEQAVQKALKISVTSTHHAYTFLPFENKVLCAVHIVYMFLIDDIAESFLEELRCFCQNFSLSKSHKHTLLDNFDTHLRQLGRYYGPYCHSSIIKSMFDYVNGRIVEHEMAISQFDFPPTARLMPMLLRTKVGGSEMLLLMIWPESTYPEETYLMQYFPIIQELVLFLDFTNDILSYYKEFVLGREKGNFVSNFSATHNMSHLDVLMNLVNYTPKLLNSAYQTLEGKEGLLSSVRTFVNGWIMLFTTHRRYHLVELFGKDRYLPAYDEDS